MINWCDIVDQVLWWLSTLYVHINNKLILLLIDIDDDSDWWWWWWKWYNKALIVSDEKENDNINDINEIMIMKMTSEENEENVA